MRVPLRNVAILLGAAGLLTAGLHMTAQAPAKNAKARPHPRSTAAQPAPAAKTPAGPGLPTFEDVTAKSGINFRHSFGETKLSSMLEATGSGCAWFDYNND